MSSSVAKPSERYITRRVVDAEGNIVVKRYKKATSSPIQIPWNRVPSALLGSLFGFYAYIVNLYRTDQLTNSLVFGELGESIKITLDSLNGITSLFLAGAVTVGLGAFLGYALITQGFKVKKWFAAGRQLLAILAFSILLSAVFSSFINEAGLIRQQDDPVDASDDFDLSELSAPFYSELLNGLLDLIGNIPNPQELVATITPGEGEPLFDPDVDTYLWRWLVAETYADDFDYDKGYTEYLSELENANAAAIAAAAPGADIKEFRVSQQYLTLGTSFSGETVNTWHSLLDGQVDVSNPGLELAEDIEGELRGDDAVSLQNNINNQPVLQADFTKSRTAGYLNFSSYFVEEDKQAIAENSLTYPNFTDSIKNDYDTSRFPQLGQAGGIDSIWGEESFSAGYLTTDFPGIDETYFTDKIDSYQAQADAGASVYSLVLQISNEIQNALLDLFNNPSAADTLNPSGDAATQNEAGEGTPRDFYFWEQVATGGLFGIKDAIAGFVNLVRALDIPARPILGFSLGNIEPEQIELRLEHISVWIEALVPWNDNGTIRHSWGMFNPIPNYSKLLQGEFVYGRNSLGGSPEIEIQASTGTETDVPDEAIGETSSFNLNGLGEPFSFGTRVLYEDTPSAGAPLSVKILSEAEIISLADGDIDPTQGLQVGYDIGDELDLTLVTSNDPGGWLNLTILVEDDTGSTLTYDGEDYDLGYTFDTIDIEGLEGERNIYAIVVVSGLAFDFLAVGWLFDGILTISPTIPPGPGTAEVTDVSDIGLFDGAETSVSYALLNEPLNYSVNLVDTDNQPVADHEIGVYILTPDDIDGLDEQFFLNNDADTTLTTDVNGDGIFSFAFNDIDYIIGEYYAILGYAGGLVYEEHIVHITGDITFNYTITNQITLDDRLIDLGEETQYIIDLDTVVTDEEIALLTIALGGSVDGRTLFSGYSFISYNIVTKDAHDTNLLNPIGYRAVLGSCGTDLTAINQDCYRLSAYSPVDGFGIVDSDFSDGQIVINMTGGVVSLNSYYLVIFDTDTQEYYVNVDQRFLFTSDPVVPLNLGGFLIDYPSQDVHQNSESNVSVAYCPILLATFPMLKRIKKEVRL